MMIIKKNQVIQNKNLFLEISPEMGATVIKFRDKKKKLDIFRPFPNSKKISKYNSYFAGYFATIPYFGAIQKNTFLIKNKYISLPRTHILESDTIHGEGWVNSWKTTKLTKNTIELVFKHNGKKSFPYAYKATQIFKLINNSLIISICLENSDKHNFDCGIGFHPWFNISKSSKIYSTSFTYFKEKRKNKFIKTKFLNKKFLDLNKYKIDETFLNWKGKSKLVVNKDISLIIKNKKNIGNLHVYSPPTEDFFCIEPVTNFRDAFYIKKLSEYYHGLKTLSPKKQFRAVVEFEVVNEAN